MSEKEGFHSKATTYLTMLLVILTYLGVASGARLWPFRSSATLQAALTVPQITSYTTYQKGQLVYFSVHYSDPGHDAKGFGFVGADGAGWAEENHSFSSPSYGIVGPDSIDYPFDLACGTARQYQSDVQAWIYDTAGTRSQPATIHLACTN
jgi:hypothetical protein